MPKNILWILDHLVIGLWIPAIVGLWRIFGFVSNLSNRAEKVESQITTLATNHFPHMESSLANQDALLKSMDANLKVIADNSHREAYRPNRNR